MRPVRVCISCFSRPTTLAPRVASRRLHHTVEHYITENDEPRVQSPGTLASLMCVMPLPRGELHTHRLLYNPGTAEIEATLCRRGYSFVRPVLVNPRPLPSPPPPPRQICIHVPYVCIRITVNTRVESTDGSEVYSVFARSRKQSSTLDVRFRQVRFQHGWNLSRHFEIPETIGPVCVCIIYIYIYIIY